VQVPEPSSPTPTPQPGTDPVRQWADQLAAWAIPEPILRAAGDRSPWVLPRQVFVDRARAQVTHPSGASYREARAMLPAGGTVIDVGCGAGAASLPLADRAGSIVGVDVDPAMLEAFRSTAAEFGINAGTVAGGWPAVAASVPAGDVVLCHHVLYNVADLEPFVGELTRHARRGVVVELTAVHPTSDLNPLWYRLHGLVRPTGPTVQTAVDALRALGLAVQSESWSRSAAAEFHSYPDLLEVTAQRLCLPEARRSELDSALRELGVEPDEPRLGPPAREVVTIWWPGTAQPTAL
jgi:SAM-dependent methyltransferase